MLPKAAAYTSDECEVTETMWGTIEQRKLREFAEKAALTTPSIRIASVRSETTSDTTDATSMHEKPGSHLEGTGTVGEGKGIGEAGVELTKVPPPEDYEGRHHAVEDILALKQLGSSCRIASDALVEQPSGRHRYHRRPNRAEPSANVSPPMSDEHVPLPLVVAARRGLCRNLSPSSDPEVTRPDAIVSDRKIEGQNVAQG